MNPDEIQKVYQLIVEYYSKYLAHKGVKLPKLENMSKKGEKAFTVSALVLVYLAKDYPSTRWVTKSELTQFIINYRPHTNDVQSARHLGMQSGFYIVSSRRGNYLPAEKPPPKESAYLLVTLEQPHPAFFSRKRSISEVSFDEIKQKYDYRCATCGSREGEPNHRYPGVITQLQQGHRNPKLPLTEENILPQCQLCNRADRNYWVYDERGRVIGIANLEPIERSIQKGYLDAQQIAALYRYLQKLLEEPTL